MFLSCQISKVTYVSMTNYEVVPARVYTRSVFVKLLTVYSYNVECSVDVVHVRFSSGG